ncbi:D-alanyl-D-alanine carboxypeptidase family protein [Thioalkalivibrio sp. HK1]|uniref:D-alanyl-D-alanine carboxypeptidase family protein n=1 Tax=Thioalkalivibrio sp. HK1 TaxID=1469245 RepID=UPI000684B068|nr:D-alanyl-D-alanine carboxypeptidase family protein [Thioalkalivibrio sp. HK1]
MPIRIPFFIFDRCKAFVARSMRSILFIATSVIAGGLLSLHPLSNADAAVPAPPQVDARAWYLMDANSGQMLVQSHADEKHAPASLTKMLTSYVVFAEMARGKFNLETQVPVSWNARRMTGSRMFLEADTLVSVEALLKGLIIQSGNDAAVALAEFISGDEKSFAVLMNRHAARLGMTRSHFTNASGLSETDQYSTARDTAFLASALVRDFPDYYPWHAIREYEYGGIVQPNRNPLLGLDPSVDGLKTGYTDAALFCLVASAEREGMRLVVSVLGAKSNADRRRFAKALLDYGFEFYETRLLYSAGQELVDARIWKGESDKVPLGIKEDLHITLPRGEHGRIGVKTDLVRISAPVKADEIQGLIRISHQENIVAERPLIALQDIARGNLWQVAKDQILLLIQ